MVEVSMQEVSVVPSDDLIIMAEQVSRSVKYLGYQHHRLLYISNLFADFYRCSWIIEFLLRDATDCLKERI